MAVRTATDRLADELRLRSVRLRKHVLQTIAAAGAGHTGGDLSCLDLLTVLYDGVLRVSPDTVDDPDRDRFVMSKGHSVEALYVVLAERGFFPASDLATVGRPGSHYVGHPTRHVPGIEQNTGALGHGLAFGVGTALAARAGRALPSARSSSPGTASWRRGRTGRRRSPPPTTGSTTSSSSSTATSCRSPEVRSRFAPWSRSPTSCGRSATR